MSKPSPRERAQTVLKQFVKLPPGEADIEYLYDELISLGNDRSMVVVAVSMLELSLEEVLAKRFGALSPEERKRLFDHGGVLGTFSAKIKIAQALDLISRREVKELEAMRVLRNAFAHARRKADFETPEIAGYAGFLQVPRDGAEPPEGVTPTPRIIFIGCFSYFLGKLLGHKKRFDIANALQALPSPSPHKQTPRKPRGHLQEN